MADVISIPIEIFTKAALDEIKKFSKTAANSLGELQKVTEKQNDALKDASKIINKLNNEQGNLNKTTKEAEKSFSTINKDIKEQVSLMSTLSTKQKVFIGSVVAVIGAAATQTKEFKNAVNVIKELGIELINSSGKLGSIFTIYNLIKDSFSTVGLAALGVKKIFENLGLNIDKIIAVLETLSRGLLLLDNRFLNLAGRSAKLASTALTNINLLADEQTKTLDELVKKIKVYGTALGGTAVVAALHSKSVVKLINNYAKLNLKAINLSEIIRAFGSTLKNTADVTSVVSRVFLKLDKGIFGLAVNLGTISSVFGAVATATKGFDNILAKVVNRISLFVALITGSLSIALTFIIKKFASLVVTIGTSLANAAEKATEKFIQFEKKTFIFERTLKGFNRSFGDSIGTIETWNKTIRKVSDQTGFTEKNLRGAVTEIIATTSAMGFNEKQQKKLLAISTDYARFLGDDVIQTTIEFISALNGQAQSVQKYGVKLGQANIEQKLLSQGLQVNYNKLSESEKIQTRFNSLLKQYKPIAGTAAAVTGTLAGQQIVLNNNVQRLSQSFGSGAAIIENNNLLAAAFNSVLNNVNDTVLEAFGFLTSFVGRLLQLAGSFLSVSFNVYAVVKAFKILNGVLQSRLFEQILNVQIPILNKSMKEMLVLAGASSVSFKSFGQTMKTVSSIIANQARLFIPGLIFQMKLLVSAIFGVDLAALSLSTALRTVLIKALILTKAAILTTAKAFLVFLANPIVIKIGLIAAAVYALYKALEVINDRTGVFTDAWDSLVDSFNDSISVFQPLIELFKTLGNYIKKGLSKAFGIFVFLISKSITLFLKFINVITDSIRALKNFSFFSKAFAGVEIPEKQISSLETASDKIDLLADSLYASGFEFKELKTNAARTTASINKSIQKIDLGQLYKLQTELQDVGLTDLDKLKRQRDERLNIIKTGLESEGKAYELAKSLELKINKDFNNQVAEIRLSEDKKKQEQESKRLNFIKEYKKSFLDMQKEVEGIVGKIGQSFQESFEFAFGGGQEDVFAKLDLQLEELEARLKSGEITELEFKAEKAALEKLGEDIKKASTVGLTTSVLNSFASGAEGASQMIVGAMKTGINAIIPGLGDAMGPMLDAFSKGPEHTKRMVDSFADALPVMVENMTLAIPAFIERIADRIDDIIIRLVENSPTILVKLIIGLVKAALKLIYVAIIEIPYKLVQSILDLVPDAIKEAFIEGLKDVGGWLYNLAMEILGPLWNLLEGIIGAIWDAVKGIGEFLYNAIVKNLINAVVAVGEFFYDLGKAIFDGLWAALQGIGSFFGDLGKSLGEAVWGALKGLGTFFYDLGKTIVDGLWDALSFAFDLMKKLFRAIFGFFGGGTGIVEDFIGFDFPFLKFAEGGLVGGNAKVKGDSKINDVVPALLSPGELVVPRSVMDTGVGGIVSYLSENGFGPKGSFLGDIISGGVDIIGGGIEFLGDTITSGAETILSGGAAVVDAIFTPAGELTASAIDYMEQFAEYLKDPEFWLEILKSLKMIGASINLKDLFTLNPITVIKGAIKNVIDFFRPTVKQLVGAGIPLAKGGMVPSGFNNDTFPARLTSGELVVDRSTTNQLQEFLSGQSGRGNASLSDEILSKILNVLSKKQTIETSVELDGDVLADIILNLNRNNARLAQ